MDLTLIKLESLHITFVHTMFCKTMAMSIAYQECSSNAGLVSQGKL